MAEICGEAAHLLWLLKVMPDHSMKNKCDSKANGKFIRMVSNGAKRILDVVVSVSGLLVLFPMFIVIAVMIKVKGQDRVFFRQTRIGQYGTPLVIYKFRTMDDRRDKSGNLLSDGERMTEIGRWLRRWSLDELPELVNVLKGEMSLVGPRPLLPRYLPRYTPEQARRHEVKPGITGWAQVNGRNAMTWEEKFALDIWYVDKKSFWLDLKILLMTPWKVLRGEGISASGEETMPEFMGSERQKRGAD